MSTRELLALLLPPVSYDPNGQQIQIEQAAEANALDAAKASAARARGAVTPFYAESLLSDWERVCGLVSAPDAAYQSRLQAVLAKLAEIGGLSIPYFTRLAASMGYQITITEPQPFRAQVNRAGEVLWAPEIFWVWQVIVHGAASLMYRYRASRSVAGERLTVFGDSVIEAVFEDLKPAHTFVYFAYQE